MKRMTIDRNEIREWLKALIISLILIVVVRTFFFTPTLVKGASMEPTLHDQDRMIITKIGEPKRFDIIVFHAPEGKDYIKRVIGLPGDRIEYKNDILFVNGEAYEEPYLNEEKSKLIDGPLTGSFTLRDTPVGSDTVPKGHLFVMGDNRRHSNDSRHIGAVPIEKVIGTTNIVYYPFNDQRIIGK